MDSSPSQKFCDESKCLSTGFMSVDGDGSAATDNDLLLFNCYAQGPGTLYPYLCADNYTGVRIPNEEVDLSTDLDLHYYTCCPPDENDTTKADDSAIEQSSLVRECTEPQTFDQTEACSEKWIAKDVCELNSPSHPYPRLMTVEPGLPLAYMCCNVDNSPLTQPPIAENMIGDSSIGGEDLDVMVNDGATSKLEFDVDGNVVPGMLPGKGYDDTTNTMPQTGLNYDIRSEIGCFDYSINVRRECYSFLFCDSCTVENTFGNLEEMICYNDEFRHPKVTMISGNTATYVCCSDPQENDSPFLINSTAYLATVWTQFSLALFASLMACLLVASIGRSLYLGKKNSPHSSTRRRNCGPDYSSYNFYLVLLAIPDLVYNLFILGIVTDKYHNGWIPHNDGFITVCAVMNQYTNAIIAREVFILLLQTKNCQRYVPPSLKKAGIQFGIVSAYAIALGILWVYLLNYSTSKSAEQAVRAAVAIPMRNFTIFGYFAVVVIAPAIFLLWICFAILNKDLIPKGEVTIGQNLRNNTPSTETPPTSMSSLKTLFFTFRKGRNGRMINRNTAANCTADCRDNTTPTRRGSTDGAAATMSGNSNHTATTQNHPPTAATNGRLNVLAMYFLRIILVFFFLWLPGVIMYYKGYQTNHNESGLLHNLALIFFSLQAIVSNGLALSKPDVRKSTIGLWAELTSCFSPTKTEDGQDNATTPTAHASSKKEASRWREDEEGDIEVPIQGEPKAVPLDQMVGKPSASPVSKVVTVHHQITNIGGVQVSQLTTHTISSFNSSSHAGGEKNDSDSDDDEGLEFGHVPPPPIVGSTRNPDIPRFLILDGDSSISRHEKDSKSGKKKKKKKKAKKEKQSSDDVTSGSSSHGKSRKGNRRLSGSHITDSPSGPPKRRNSRTGSSKGKSESPHTRMKKRLSINHRDPSSTGKPVGPPRQQRRNSLTGLTGIPVNKNIRLSISNHDKGNTPINSPAKRRSSYSDAPKRGNSRSDSNKITSPQSQSRKKQLMHSRLNGSDRSAGHAKQTMGSIEKTGKSPVVQSKKTKSPVQRSKRSSKSPSRRKKTEDTGKHASEPPLGQQYTEDIKNTTENARKSPSSQSKKRRASGNGSGSTVPMRIEEIEIRVEQQNRRLSDTGSGSHVSGSSKEKKLVEQIEKNFGHSGSTETMKIQKEKRMSTESFVGNSSNPTSSRTKKRISNTKRISYDGTVSYDVNMFDQC